MATFVGWCNFAAAVIYATFGNRPIDPRAVAVAAFVNIAGLWFAVAKLEKK